MEQGESELSAQAKEMHLETAIPALRGTRYYALAREVLLRLPEKWDLYRTFTIELSPNAPRRPGLYAGCYRPDEAEEMPVSPLEGREEQFWIVTLYDQALCSRSSEAVRWVIAHELAHVAAGVPCGTLVIGGIPHTKVKGVPDEEFYRPITREEVEAGEKIADAIARAWGFWEEEEAWFQGTPSD